MDIKKNSLMILDLQLCADGGAGAGDGGTGAEGATGVSATAAVSQKKGVKSNPLANVVYGTQQKAEGISAAENVKTTSAESAKDSGEAKPLSEADRKAAYEEYIKANKDLDDARVQNIVRQRVKAAQDVADKYNALSPTLELLAKKYGVDASDPDALAKAIEDDDALYEQEALAKGMEVSELKAYKKVQRENSSLREQLAERERQDAAKKQSDIWLSQETEAKTKYPSLDLATELNNPQTGQQFARLLKSGVDVGTAYGVIHMNEIVPVMMQHAERQAKEKIANKIASNASRPTENGMSSQGAMQTKSDVSQLTKADRAEIIRRVARGEKITFTK